MRERTEICTRLCETSRGVFESKRTTCLCAQAFPSIPPYTEHKADGAVAKELGRNALIDAPSLSISALVIEIRFPVVLTPEMTDSAESNLCTQTSQR